MAWGRRQSESGLEENPQPGQDGFCYVPMYFMLQIISFK